MLVRLLYASRAAESVHADTLAAILKVSKEHNHATGVTGVLCHCAARSARFTTRSPRIRAIARSSCSATRRSASAAFPAGPWAR